eukprot:m.343640 g.343640  ORF g.343640 m.343640 type:complete len:476 (+) comp23099_c0_seq1:141-1568(+)
MEFAMKTIWMLYLLAATLGVTDTNLILPPGWERHSDILGNIGSCEPASLTSIHLRDGQRIQDVVVDDEPKIIHSDTIQKLVVNWRKELSNAIELSRNSGGDELTGVYTRALPHSATHSDGVFFNHDKSLPMIDLYPSKTFEHIEVNMSLYEIVRSNESFLRYWAGNLDDIGVRLESDILHTLQPKSDVWAARGWLASPGVKAALHYDVFHNTLVQVHGYKRVWLLPPQAQGFLYLYPSLHPRYRQSQVCEDIKDQLSKRNSSKFPRAEAIYNKDSQLSVLTLAPGDILYIPPFWFHAVETLESRSTDEGSAGIPLELSFSINIWSEDAHLVSAENIFKAPIPFEDTWTEEKTRRALIVYSGMLVQAVIPGTTSSTELTSFFKDFLHLRLQNLNSEREEVLSRLCADETDLVLDMDLKSKFIERATQTVKPLLELDPAIRVVYVQDLLEEMIAHFVGLEEIHDFTKYCLCDSEVFL